MNVIPTRSWSALRDPLLLAARQLRRPPRSERRHVDQREGLVDPGLELGLGAVRVLEAERHVVEDRHEREQRVALEHRVDVALVRRHAGDVDPVEQDAARGRLLEPGDQPQGGRLAAAGRPEQREELPAGHRQVDIVDRGRVAVVEPLSQPDELNACGHAVISVSATRSSR
jgi:hypothetical protein